MNWFGEIKIPRNLCNLIPRFPFAVSFIVFARRGELHHFPDSVNLQVRKWRLAASGVGSQSRGGREGCYSLREHFYICDAKWLRLHQMGESTVLQNRGKTILWFKLHWLTFACKLCVWVKEEPLSCFTQIHLHAYASQFNWNHKIILTVLCKVVLLPSCATSTIFNPRRKTVVACIWLDRKILPRISRLRTATPLFIRGTMRMREDLVAWPPIIKWRKCNRQLSSPVACFVFPLTRSPSTPN